MKRKLLILVALVAVFWASSAVATSIDFTFLNITNNGPIDIGSQLLLTITDETVGLAVNQIDFVFKNNASTGNVHEIYIYDGILESNVPNTTVQIINGSGVNFTGPTSNPADLPGAANAPYWLTGGTNTTPAYFNADSQGAGGMGPGETVTLRFSPNANIINQVISNLDNWISATSAERQAIDWTAPQTNYLAVGMHVGSIGPTEYSDSFVAVPLPGAVLLLGAGLVRLAAYARRRKGA